MNTKIKILTILGIFFPGNIALAGGFYKLTPYWLEYVYHFALLGLVLISLIISFHVFKVFKGGKLGKSWFLFLLAFIAIIARSVLGLLVIFDIAYFHALAFAGLDVLFYLLLTTGLILYKTGLD